MIINPIIPIFIMAIICIALLIIVIHDNSKLKKTKIAIILLLFTMNLRFMLPDGESPVINSDLNILFVIDKSVSMRALDYDGNKERLEGVKKDCSYILDELSGSRFSLITFGDSADFIIPYTTDTDMVKAEINSIVLENDFYSTGTSINIVKDLLEKKIKDKTIIFFITDGEITKENEKLESFKTLSPYISNGAVLGYGTTNGGKMVNSIYADEPYSDYYYLTYYEEDYNIKQAISKIDENNLNSLANDMGIDYIHMTKTADINDKIKEIKRQMNSSESIQVKVKSYKDIYYYFAIPLVILFIIDFTNKKRKI